MSTPALLVSKWKLGLHRAALLGSFLPPPLSEGFSQSLFTLKKEKQKIKKRHQTKGWSLSSCLCSRYTLGTSVALPKILVSRDLPSSLFPDGRGALSWCRGGPRACPCHGASPALPRAAAVLGQPGLTQTQSSRAGPSSIPWVVHATSGAEETLAKRVTLSTPVKVKGDSPLTMKFFSLQKFPASIFFCSLCPSQHVETLRDVALPQGSVAL